MANPGVLLVEDDQNLREALRETLVAVDVPVFAAENGEQALAILRRESIGLVVSDLQMEPMDGHTLLGEIRQQHPTLPAVLMTAPDQRIRSLASRPAMESDVRASQLLPRGAVTAPVVPACWQK